MGEFLNCIQIFPLFLSIIIEMFYYNAHDCNKTLTCHVCQISQKSSETVIVKY